MNNLITKLRKVLITSLGSFLIGSCSKGEREPQGMDNKYLLDALKLDRTISNLTNFRDNDKILQVLEVPRNNSLRLGSSIDITSNDAYPQAITSDFHLKNDKNFTFNTAKSFCTSSSSSFDEKISTFFNASVSSCIIEASVKYGNINNFSNSKNDITFYQIHVSVSDEKTYIKDYKLCQNALDLFKERGLIAFFERYGTHYASEYICAGYFIGQIKLTAQSTSNYDKTELELHTKLDAFFTKGELNFERKKEVCEFNKKYKIETFATWSGVDFCTPVNTLDGVLEAYKIYTEKVNIKTLDTPTVFICTPFINLLPNDAFDQICNIEKFIYDKVEALIYRKVEGLLSSLSEKDYEDAAKKLLKNVSFTQLTKFIRNIDNQDKNRPIYLRQGLQNLLQKNYGSDNNKILKIIKILDDTLEIQEINNTSEKKENSTIMLNQDYKKITLEDYSTLKNLKTKHIILCVSNEGRGKKTVGKFLQGKKFFSKKIYGSDSEDHSTTLEEFNTNENDISNENSYMIYDKFSLFHITKDIALCNITYYSYAEEINIDTMNQIILVINLLYENSRVIIGLLPVFKLEDLSMHNLHTLERVAYYTLFIKNFIERMTFEPLKLYLLINITSDYKKLMKYDKLLNWIESKKKLYEKVVNNSKKDRDTYSICKKNSFVEVINFLDLFLTTRNVIQIAPHLEESRTNVLEIINGFINK